MSESTVACPHCQQPIRVMTEHAGSQVACPICHRPMVVPQFEQLENHGRGATVEPSAPRAESEQAAAPAAAPAAADVTDDLHTFACSHCAQPFQVTGEFLGQAVRCPACGDAMQLPGPADADPVSARPRPSPTPHPRPSLPRAAGSTDRWRLSPQEKARLQQEAAKKANVPIPLDADGTLPSVASGRGASFTYGADASRLLPPRFEPLLPRMSDLSLSSDGKAVASMSFQEPVKTILVHGQERVLRRLTPEEKTVRRRQRNVVVFSAGMLLLVVVGLLLARWA